MVKFLPNKITPVYGIDFETSSDLNLRSVGAWAYAMHPSTQILLMAYKPFGSQEPVRYWEPGQPMPVDPRLHMCAHNAEFDFAIWNCVARRDDPSIPIWHFEQVWDSMALCAHAGLPRSLEDAGLALGIETPKQAKRGKVLVHHFANRLWDKETHPKEWAEFIDYAKVDVLAMEQLLGYLPPMTPLEREIYLEHLRINARGIQLDVESCIKLKDIRDAAEHMLVNYPDGALLTRPMQLQAWLEILGTDVPDCRKDTLLEALPSASPEAADLIRRRLAVGKASTKKLKRAIESVCPDGHLRGMHVYFAAHTGRFGGAIMQPQNIKRLDEGFDVNANIMMLSCLPDEVQEAIRMLGGPEKAIEWVSNMIRPMLCAINEGEQLVGADFTAVEARQNAWLTGCSLLLNQFATGVDPYRAMGGLIFGIPDYASLAKKSFERFVGKQTILGCVAAGTPVLTDRGWVPIQDVQISDKLWDGEEWVQHNGLVYQGIKLVLGALTPDHLVLGKHGQWVTWDQYSIASLRPTTKAATYDLLNAGPRQRFTIRTHLVGPVIAHNCGYGMGWKKFIIYCLDMAGIVVEPSIGKKAVDDFRTNYWEIPAGWKAFDEGIAAAYDDQNGYGRYLFDRKIILACTPGPLGSGPDNLVIRLPSGRPIRYLFPRYARVPGRTPEHPDEYQLTYLTPQKQGNAGFTINSVIRARARDWREEYNYPTFDESPYLATVSGMPKVHGMSRVTSWGGKVDENVIQAISRDLLAQAMLRLRARYPVRLHVHDELASKAKLQEHVEEVFTIMRQVPDWGTGSLIDVEGWHGQRFH